MSTDVLGAIYSDPRHPGSFSGVEKLRKILQKKNVKISDEEIKKWLKGKDTYTKHRTSRKNFGRNPIVAAFIDAQWQGDLAEVGNLSSQNDGVRYLLVLIDVVSKYLWVEGLKSKHGNVVLQGLKKILERAGGRKPVKIQTDDGKEFLDARVQDFLKSQKIKFFTVKSDKKAAIAERVIRTLKEKLYRYMHEKHTKRYVDVLQDLVASYNETPHSSIGVAPAEVNYENEGEVLERLYGAAWEQDGIRVAGKAKKKKSSAKLVVGDLVRISKLKGPFKKGYLGNWTEEIFVVSKIKGRFPNVMYKLKDWSGEEIKGSFYEKEVQGVDKDMNGYWKVEKVLRQKMVRGRKKYFVKWEGYPDSMNSWVDAADIKDLRPSRGV